MKTVHLLPILLLAACSQAPDSDKAVTTEKKEVSTMAGVPWIIDASASELKWIGTKVTGYHIGNIPVQEGELYIKDGNLAGGKVIFDMKKLVVNGPSGSDEESNTKLQQHLMKPDFFDVEKYPLATFEITGVTESTETTAADNDDRLKDDQFRVTQPTHHINGNLTIKGVSKNIEFPARVTISGNMLEAQARFNIDRTMWGITYPGKPDDLIRKDVHIAIHLKASKRD